jgi:hypothetical protein
LLCGISLFRSYLNCGFLVEDFLLVFKFFFEIGHTATETERTETDIERKGTLAATASLTLLEQMNRVLCRQYCEIMAVLCTSVPPLLIIWFL